MKDNHIGLRLKTYTFSRVLGSGAWATVYEVFDDRTKDPVACKVIPKRLMDQTPKLKQLVQTEITVLQKCKNENVIRYIDSFSNDKNVYIFTEFCNGGDMEEYLKKKGRLQEDQAREFLKQILNGFRGLHEVGALHRDFKTANILLHNGVAKIADLGFAKILKTKAMTGTILGTSVTMAPQLLEGRNYGIECDVWSVGVVYYQLLQGDYPYSGISDQEILKQIKSRPPYFPPTVDISGDSKDFILKCLTVDPKKRIQWRSIYEHPLLQEKKNQGRSTYLGTLNSRISLGENQAFYQKEQPQIGIPQQKPSKDFEFARAQLEEAQDFGRVQEEAERRRAAETNIQRHSALYLQRRNQIMLALKFGVTPIFELQALPFNQNLYAFLLCKKAYFDMGDFRKQLLNKANQFNITNFWKEFVASQTYKRLTDQALADYDLVSAYAQSFMLEVETSNSQLQAELSLDFCTKNFATILKEELNSYAFLLYENKDRPNINRHVLMRLIRFVLDAATGINMPTEQYDKRVEGVDVKQIEAEFADKMKSLYG